MDVLFPDKLIIFKDEIGTKKKQSVERSFKDEGDWRAEVRTAKQRRDIRIVVLSQPLSGLFTIQELDATKHFVVMAAKV